MKVVKFARKATFLATMAVSMQISAAEWSGCYLGANAGYGDGDNQINQTFFEGNVINHNGGSTSSDGTIYGAQFGCDYQPSEKWVAGFQLSASKANIEGRHVFVGGTGPDNYVSYETDQTLSVAGRFGYLVKDSTLLYTKIGWVTTDQLYTDQDPTYDPPLFYQTSESRSGWTAGVGIEHKFVENVSFFAEFNHIDLGREENIALDNLGEIDISDYLASIDQSMNQYMVGMNYYF